MVVEDRPDSQPSNRLAANSVTFRHVMAQGFISNAPLASVAVSLTTAAAFGLGALPLTYVLGAIMALVWINTPFQFSKRIGSAGGLFSFIRAGLGEKWAFSAGIGYLAYYLLLVPANALTVSVLITTISSSLGYSLPGWIWFPIAVVVIIPSYVIAYFRLRPGLNYGVVTGIVEVVVLVVLSIIFIFHSGVTNTTHVYDPSIALHGFSGVLVGMAVASTGLGGPTAVVYLAEESHAPGRTIKRAMLTTQIVVVVLYLLVSYALTVAWGPGKMGSFASSGVPGLILVDRYLGRGPELILAVLLINSIIGVDLAVNIGMARMIYHMSRIGLLPVKLQETHPKHKTPTPALLLSLIVELVFSIIAGFVWGPINGFIVMIVAATAGGLLSHILANIALISYSARQKIFKVVTRAVLPCVSIGFIGVAIYGNFFPVTYPAWVGAAIVLVAMITALVYAFGRRSPTLAEPDFTKAMGSDVVEEAELEP